MQHGILRPPLFYLNFMLLPLLCLIAFTFLLSIFFLVFALPLCCLKEERTND